MWGFLPEEAVFQWCAHSLHNSTGRFQIGSFSRNPSSIACRCWFS